jgi:hypothetical protein
MGAHLEWKSVGSIGWSAILGFGPFESGPVSLPGPYPAGAAVSDTRQGTTSRPGASSGRSCSLEVSEMANWLVCFPKEVAAPERDVILTITGITVLYGGEPVPLGEEVAVRVSADKGTVDALRENRQVRGIFPDSEPEPY